MFEMRYDNAGSEFGFSLYRIIDFQFMSVGGYFRFDEKLLLVKYLYIDGGMVDKEIAFAHRKLRRMITASMETRVEIGSKVSASYVPNPSWGA